MTEKLYTSSIKTVLYIEFDSTIKNDKHLTESYKKLIRKHNINMMNCRFYDSGFDILTHNECVNLEFKPNDVNLVPLGIKCACFKFDIAVNPDKIPIYRIISESIKRRRGTSARPSPFMLLPRSSMWKSGFLLANSKGVIDSGYRGFLRAPMFCFKENSIMKYQNRYLQICMPSMERFIIKVVDELKTDTQRGYGGFGSTGK